LSEPVLAPYLGVAHCARSAVEVSNPLEAPHVLLLPVHLQCAVLDPEREVGAEHAYALRESFGAAPKVAAHKESR